MCVGGFIDTKAFKTRMSASKCNLLGQWALHRDEGEGEDRGTHHHQKPSLPPSSFILCPKPPPSTLRIFSPPYVYFPTNPSRLSSPALDRSEICAADGHEVFGAYYTQAALRALPRVRCHLQGSAWRL